MLNYYGFKLLQDLYDYYTPRFHLAEERGYGVEGNKYAWLFEELRLRILTIRQTILYLEALPKFMVGVEENQPMQYVVSFTSKLFTEQSVGHMDRDEENNHPFYNKANPYWVAFEEIQEHFSTDYDMRDLPMLYVDLTEYVVRALRLYLQIREARFHAIDREKFDELMEAKAPLPKVG